jgi:hypothetical protein
MSTIANVQTFAVPHHLDSADLDAYAQRGVALSRDATSVVIAALIRDAQAMEARGGSANLEAAERQRELAKAMNTAVCAS